MNTKYLFNHVQRVLVEKQTNNIKINKFKVNLVYELIEMQLATVEEINKILRV